MENTGNATEADPLKRGEEGGEPGQAPSSSPATELRKKGCKEVIGFAKLTHWRTAVFFFSLFLCLTIVFAFSFIIPCPVRPQYLPSWNRTYNNSGWGQPSCEGDTFVFVRVLTRPCLFLFILQPATTSYLFKMQAKTRWWTSSLSSGTQRALWTTRALMQVWYLCVCFFERKWACSLLNVFSRRTGNALCFPGLPSPCVFMVALDGTDGATLWERPLQPDFHYAQCGLEKDSGRNWDCLLSHSNQLSALDKSSGQGRAMLHAFDVTWLCFHAFKLNTCFWSIFLYRWSQVAAASAVWSAKHTACSQHPRSKWGLGRWRGSSCLRQYTGKHSIQGSFYLFQYKEDEQKVTDAPGFLIKLYVLQTQVLFISGKTGEQIGSTVVLDAMETASHLPHHTSKGSQYLLLQRGLCLCSNGSNRLQQESSQTSL